MGQLEDIKIKEDKKKTENEHLLQDIADLEKRIDDAKEEQKRLKEEKEERERLDRENAEKERLKKEEEEQKTEEQLTDIRVDAPKKNSESIDAKSPLVKKNQPKGAESGCCCTIL